MRQRQRGAARRRVAGERAERSGICYAEMGADYAEVLERLRDERLIRRYVLRFPDDPSYDALCRAMSGGRVEEAFLAAHTLKGITQSLGFGGLCTSASALTEALRNGVWRRRTACCNR